LKIGTYIFLDSDTTLILYIVNVKINIENQDGVCVNSGQGKKNAASFQPSPFDFIYL